MITPTSITLPANSSGYYVLWYDAATKTVRNVRKVYGVTVSPATSEGYLTWAEVVSRATALGLSGMPTEAPTN